MSDLVSSPAYLLARRIDLRGAQSRGWFVLLKPEDGDGAFLRDLAGEAKVWWNAEIRIIEAENLNVLDICRLLQTPSEDGVVIRGLEAWSDEGLQALDLNRSGLDRPGFVVLWLTLNGLHRLFRNCPNLRSWIGGREFQSAPDPSPMTDEECRARLVRLSEKHRLTDGDVIRMAEAGTLPSDPEFVEWLIFLGRGDLVR